MEHGKPFSATQSPLVDFDAVCQKVRAAVEPARAHAVSLHDEHGDVLWLTESSMGPDEHNAVREAIEAFANPGGPPVLVYDLGDSRSAVLLRAVNGQRAMVGAIMIVMDARVVKQDARGALKVMTPKLQRVLADFSAMRPDSEPLPETPLRATAGAALSLVNDTPAPRPAAPRAIPAPPAASATAAARAASPPAPQTAPSPPRSAPATRSAAAARVAPASSPTSAAAPAAPPPASRPASAAARMAAPAKTSATAPSPHPVPRMAPPVAEVATANEFANKRPHEEVTPEIDRLHAALRRSPIALHVQRLVPLTKGSQLKRYEVLLRSKSDSAPNAAPHAMLKAAVDNGLGSMIDRRVITELIGYLVHHPEVWKSTAVMFSVNLTTTALHDEHFIKFVELCLAKSSLPKGMIAFEVDTATAVKLADKMPEVAAALHRLGCPLVLDDFALKTECFALLRLPGVHYVKLAPEITAKMRTDKLSQAAITAVVQMARVLGMHTVAKRTENAAEQEWLTALGVDFVQSNSMSPPVSIDSLSKAAPPARPLSPTA
jgi:EAL domain-containing protein (putative c-di-GMP-specific phosphodiesterase class I)